MEFVQLPRRYKDVQTQTDVQTTQSPEVEELYNHMARNHNEIMTYLKRLEDKLQENWKTSTVIEENNIQTPIGIRNYFGKQASSAIENAGPVEVPDFSISDDNTPIAKSRNPMSKIVPPHYVTGTEFSYDTGCSEELPCATYCTKKDDTRDRMSLLFRPELWPVIENVKYQTADRDELVFKLFLVFYLCPRIYKIQTSMDARGNQNLTSI